MWSHGRILNACESRLLAPSYGMTDDPLSDMLTFLNARSILSGGLMAGGAWALRFPRPNAIKFCAAVKGRCWLALAEQGAPVCLEAGDVILLNGKHPFILASDLSAPPMDAADVFVTAVDRIAKLGDGDEFHLLGGHVALDPTGVDLLLDVLPPLIHVRATSAEATVVQWLLDQLVRERVSGRPGAALASTQLAQLMFVQVLRAHIAQAEPLSVGWLRAIGDERIVPALRLMHGDPGRSWQLGELAKAVGMSRTTFALRFKTVAGIAPLAYLLGWRMRLAERALREGSLPVSALALSLGYTSESAFSNAFKRVVGVAPKRYRSTARVSNEVAATGEAEAIMGEATPAPARYMPVTLAS
jgi:AraC-like DNA-binding protein